MNSALQLYAVLLLLRDLRFGFLKRFANSLEAWTSLNNTRSDGQKLTKKFLANSFINLF